MPLASFLGYIDEDLKFGRFVNYLEVFPNYVLRDYLTKENGLYLDSTEQFELFAKLLTDKGYEADIYLYQQGQKRHISKTNEHEKSTHIIPVIRLLDGRFAATSIFNPFSFDLKNRLLRTETQQIRKEKRIAKNKLYFAQFLSTH